MTQPPIRAVLLDLDETLTARAPTVRAYAERFVAQFGAQLASDDLGEVHAEIVRIDDNGYNYRRAEDLACSTIWPASPGA